MQKDTESGTEQQSGSPWVIFIQTNAAYLNAIIMSLMPYENVTEVQ